MECFCWFVCYCNALYWSKTFCGDQIKLVDPYTLCISVPEVKMGVSCCLVDDICDISKGSYYIQFCVKKMSKIDTAVVFAFCQLNPTTKKPFKQDFNSLFHCFTSPDKTKSFQVLFQQKTSS